MIPIEAVIIDYSETLSSARYFRNVPLACPDWPQRMEEVLFSKDSSLFDDWMAGRFSTREIAEYLAPLWPLSAEEIEEHLREGCRGLGLNAGVVNFVQDQRRLGRRTALVTCNIDLFTEEVVPDQGLDSLFDVIVNSADHKDLRKEALWPLAFERLRCDYANAFALDDRPAHVERFAALGGQAHRYSDDVELWTWLQSEGPVARLLQRTP